MSPIGAPPEQEDGGDVASAELSAADLFTVLWQALADILGTAATATLLRRATQTAVQRWPELAELSITRANLEYGFSVPPAWKDDRTRSPGALCALVSELCKLLVDLTGSVVVNRLKLIPELVERGVIATGDPS
jgi:hypothetical protein